MSRVTTGFVLFSGCFFISSARAQTDDVRPQIVQALLVAVSDNDAGVRKTAFNALAKTAENNMQVGAALQAGMKDADDDVRLAALNAFLKIVNDPEEKSRVLVELLDDFEARRIDEWGDEIPNMTQLARRYLRKIGAPAVPGLVAALADERKKVSALQVLKQIGPEAKDAAPAVVALLKDGDAKTRKKAVDLLAVLGGEATEVVPQLTEMLGDVNAGVRRSAVVCLTEYGGEAKPALPKLLELVKDADPTVRKKTLVCLGAIARNSRRPAGMDRNVWNFSRRIFRDIDTDKDGQISAGEARDYELDSEQYDANQDDVISLEEFAQEFAKEQQLEEMPFLEIAPFEELQLIEFPR